ncbi:MAG: FliM/FliN family flagellar motor switch protein [Hyphomicrobium sp.]|uniref:FliM/FliN family flagellar motor switch protein n=1 Tax=Hyphomicrobium sp. CS1BSMeth3 TaxID=1892844 RepID=UPI0009F9DD96|nr:FliM/FliN family flagellar motor switch protein [Hyphomicrobium sp. CS1BSMeth3]MBN9260294.1 FliM/FliN family flagellar motor switch protein [Hyphomicrobium sp.]MBN9266684.1 FliM/FliN family flagellar motor switch protein [Hyphomicrobium sp.]
MNNFESGGAAGDPRGRQQGDWRSDLTHVSTAGGQEGKTAEGWGVRGHDAVMRIPVSVRFVLGATRMPVAKLMSLTRGAIIPLDRKVGDLIDIVVNDQVVARGEIVALDEEATRFGISVREVTQPGGE